MANLKFYTEREEKANYLTHAFGVVMAVVGSYILISKASAAENSWAVCLYALFYGISLCAKT